MSDLKVTGIITKVFLFESRFSIIGSWWSLNEENPKKNLRDDFKSVGSSNSEYLNSKKN